MAHVLINGISAKSGGGRSILTNFLSVLNARGSKHRFSVTVPDKKSYAAFASANVRLLSMPMLSKTMLLPLAASTVLPRVIRRHCCDLVFNLADIPIRTRTTQIFLFDWPHAAYPQSPAWERGNFADSVKRRMKLHFFRSYLRYIDVMIAQGPAIRDRLMSLYRIDRMPVVPNAVSLDNLSAGESYDFALGGGFKLLCLSHYYSHKNLEILIPLAELIRERQLDLKIIITIDAGQGQGARELLAMIAERKLSDIVVNVGPVPMARVPSLYRQTDALLLPTLLESFSGTYVEAMFHGKPIFTSHYEFALDVCKDAAFYFDPLDVGDILDKIGFAITHPEECAKRVADGRRLLEGMMNWNQAFDAYLALIDETLAEQS